MSTRYHERKITVSDQKTLFLKLREEQVPPAKTASIEYFKGGPWWCGG